MLPKQLSLPENKKIFLYIALLVIVLALYFGLIYLLKYLGFPSSEEIIAFTQKYYETYGYSVVLVGALAEGALSINWYLPGSIVVALGVVFAKQAGLNIFLMLGLVVLGFFLTALFNYALGRFGWYHVLLKLGLQTPLEKMQSKVADKGLKILFTTYVHPNFGALAATAAGIFHLSFKKFALYSFISIVLWNSFWTAVFYWFGAELLNHLNWLIAGGAIFVYIMFTKSFKKESRNHLNLP